MAALAARMDGEPKGLLGISACTGGEAWRYLIAVASQADPGPFETYTVPAATWAVFSGEGTGRSIQALEKRIVTEWLPGSGYEYATDRTSRYIWNRTRFIRAMRCGCR